MGVRLWHSCLNCLFQKRGFRSDNLARETRSISQLACCTVRHRVQKSRARWMWFGPPGKPLHPLINACHVRHLIRGNIMQVIIVCFETDGRFTQNVPVSLVFIVVTECVCAGKLVCSWFVPFYQHVSSLTCRALSVLDLLIPVDGQE